MKRGGKEGCRNDCWQFYFEQSEKKKSYLELIMHATGASSTMRTRESVFVSAVQRYLGSVLLNMYVLHVPGGKATAGDPLQLVIHQGTGNGGLRELARELRGQWWDLAASRGGRRAS